MSANAAARAVVAEFAAEVAADVERLDVACTAHDYPAEWVRDLDAYRAIAAGARVAASRPAEHPHCGTFVDVINRVQYSDHATAVAWRLIGRVQSARWATRQQKGI